MTVYTPDAQNCFQNSRPFGGRSPSKTFLWKLMRKKNRTVIATVLILACVNQNHYMIAAISHAIQEKSFGLCKNFHTKNL